MLANTGRWMAQARSCAGKPWEKREVRRPVLSEVWVLDRPKKRFNITLLLLLKLIGARRKSVQKVQEKSTFFLFPLTVEVKFWNWLPQEVVETDSISPFQKELDKSVDNKSIKIYWRKGSGRDVYANIPDPRNVDVGEDCRSWQVMQVLPAGLDGLRVSPSREFLIPSTKDYTPCWRELIKVF